MIRDSKRLSRNCGIDEGFGSGCRNVGRARLSRCSKEILDTWLRWENVELAGAEMCGD